MPSDSTSELVRCLKAVPLPAMPECVAALFARGRMDVVEEAVEEGVLSPNFEMSDGSQLIHAAAIGGGFGGVDLLRCLTLRHGVDPNQRFGEGIAPLHVAARDPEGHAAVLFLINEVPGIDVNVRGPLGVTPLILAAKKGFLPVMRALVAKGADVDAVDASGLSAVVHASAMKQFGAALYLLEEAGASWEVRGGVLTLLNIWAPLGMTDLLKAVLLRMRASGLDEAAVGHAMACAAVVAISSRLLTVLPSLKFFVEEGLDVKSAQVRVMTGSNSASLDDPVLARAEELYGAEAVERLLQTDVEEGLLHKASKAGDRSVIEWLIAQGCDPFAVNSCGFMPIHTAAGMGHTAVVQWYLQKVPGLHVDTAADGTMGASTALHVAAARGHEATVKWLLAAGANPLLRERRGARPSDTAVDGGYVDLAAFLREREAEAEAEAAAASEAAARRARNEKRRQKMKKAKARLRAAAEAAGADEEGEVEEPDAASLAAGMAGLAVAGGASGGGEQQQEQEQEQELQEVEEPAAAAAAPPAARSQPPPPPPPLEDYLEAHAPEGLLCPISLELMGDAVVLAADGFTYSEAAIEGHFDRCRKDGKALTSPKTNLEIADPAKAVLVPNHLVRGFVLEYKEAKTKEWEALQREWEEAQEAQQEN